MDKITDISPGNKVGDKVTDTLQSGEPQLTQKLDEVTVFQMKEIEVQRIQDDLTVKMSNREYLEIKRNLAFKQKKLEDAKKKISDHADRIDKLLQAQEELIKKMNELKVYQYEIILIDFNSKEKTYSECNLKARKLSSMHQTVLRNKNQHLALQKDLSEKKSLVNKENCRQLEINKEHKSNLFKKFSQNRLKVENLQLKLGNDLPLNNRKVQLEDKNKRIIKLRAAEEELLKKLKTDNENLVKEKSVKINDLNEAKIRSITEKKETVKEILTEITSSETNASVIKDVYERTAGKKEEILKEIEKKKHHNENLKTSCNKTVVIKMSEIEEIKLKIKVENDEFNEKEESKQTELRSLYSKFEEKKKITKKLENQQKELTKLKETRQFKQKELLDDNLKEKQKKYSDEFENIEKCISAALKKHTDCENKRKELEDVIKNIKKQLEQKTGENKENIVGSEASKKVSQLTNNFKKLLNVDGEDIENKEKSSQKKTPTSTHKDSEQDSIRTLSQKETPTTIHKDVKLDNPEKSSQKKTFLSTHKDASYKKFYCDSDSSEDEMPAINKPEKEIMPSSNQKSIYDFDDDPDDSISGTKYQSLSQSEKLFEDMISQSSSLKTNEQEVFKKPHTYATPMRKKSSYSRKH